MSGFGIFILTLGLLSSIAQSLRFDLQSGHTKCIAEDIKNNAMTVGKYSIVNFHEGYPLPDSHRITARVTSSYGNNYHYGDTVESGQFAFTAAESGDYMTCFSVLDHHPPVTLTVDFDWRTGVAAKDWSNVAKKGQIDVSNYISSPFSSKLLFPGFAFLVN
ncbi:transmembrane emp24 domain-containing protein p24delta9-like [Macadamia integrifolia]|uniref:transmembrane emp24 domain-containing protein p24delta9-like n=1 Tax=Macadamia integrifolia TaxID=60698 RepID=UPI001C50252B|nr:transmembrane emp24 domain-containing protein p24delta9-like [Macadamia integrifolia]